MKLFTIGFTKKSAEEFFGLLRDSGAKRVVDVRLNNTSQLAGFAKRRDLEYLLSEICGMEYVHLPELAPTKQIRDHYNKGGRDWQAYEVQFFDLMQERRIADRIDRNILSDGCLLCSEHRPDRCHRRLVAEYLNDRWGGIEITHLR